ncbi:MAG: S-layer homology domain-containing protein [candidate division WOR-3 bacterium]
MSFTKKLFLLVFIVLILSSGCFKKNDRYLSFFISKIDKEYSFLKDLEKKDTVTRSDVAYLFGIYFPENVYVYKDEIPFDIKMFPKNEILYAQVKRGIIPSFPDNTFKPDTPVLRYQLAVFLYTFILNNGFLSNFKMNVTEIKDVNENFFAYKPISNIVFLGIMELEDGFFYPYRTVSGYELIKFFYRLNNLFYK